MMTVEIIGRKVNLKDSFKEKAERKLGKFARFFSDEAEAHVTVTVEKKRQTVEVTVKDSGFIYRAEAVAEDMLDALDRVCDVLIRQIHKNKTKLERRLRSGAFMSLSEESVGEHKDVTDETEYKIIRSKRFVLRPTPVDEAILRMNMLGHQFYMFQNAETGNINVVYRRQNGDYGLIEPDLE
jgi:putative sigma-54 modulation protein